MLNKDKFYDVFISYSRFDVENDQYLPLFVEALQKTFKSLTGNTLSVFVDVNKINTAELWEEKIYDGLKKSSVMIAFLSPSYFASEWCCKEWDYFVSFENENRRKINSLSSQGLIFPIKLINWSKAFRFSEEQKGRVNDAEKRQYLDLENIPPKEKMFSERIQVLVEDIIEVLEKIEKDKIYLNSPSPKSLASSLHLPPHPIIRIGSNQEEFVQRLSESIRVVIVGTTHKNLTFYLENALNRKKQSKEGVFWQDLKIVFLNEGLLSYVEDDLSSSFPDQKTSMLQRKRASGQAKRSLSYFLIRQNYPRQWSLYEYNRSLPFIGAFFEMANGQKIVQVATLRPGFRTSEHLFFEIDESMMGALAYYESTFNDIVQRSQPQNEIVLIGNPDANMKNGFIVSHSRFRRSVLLDSSNNGDWIAVFILVLWKRENGETFPLLQIRTPENATRELDMLSNISGYINQRDCVEFDQGKTNQFLLEETAVKNAVFREVEEELSIVNQNNLEPKIVGEVPFYYPDKENLYFYLCEMELPSSIEITYQPACMKRWDFDKILSVRKIQVLRKAMSFVDTVDSNISAHKVTLQVLRDNLILHRLDDLALEILDTNNKRITVINQINKIIKEETDCYEFHGVNRPVLGLAGLQYREFFQTIAPLYASLGVKGAQEYCLWLNSNKSVNEALHRLIKHYRNAESLREDPFDF